MAEFISGLRYQSVVIKSFDGTKSIDLTNSILGIDYYEDILSPQITMTMNIKNSYSIVNGLPIRGGESVSMQIETGSGTFKLEGEKALFVYKVGEITAPTKSENFTLYLSSAEGLTNNTIRCLKKYPKQSIDTSVKDILKNVLKAPKTKIGTIEKTSNSYSFIGNNKKPFHVLTWLGPKAVSQAPGTKGVSGKGVKAEAKGISGFLFFENYDGFHFRSIDSLTANTQLEFASSNKSSITPYNYGQFAIQSNDPQNNFNIINYNIDKNIDLQKSLRVGMYANQTYIYDVYKQEFSIYNYDLKKEIKNQPKLGGEADLQAATNFSGNPSRILVRMSDHGFMETTGKFEESGADYTASAKSFSRYNLLFTQSLNITIPLNINLKAGNLIYCQFPKMQAGQSKEIDPEISGNYLISQVCHHFAGGQCYSYLKLIRDSYGVNGPNQ